MRAHQVLSSFQRRLESKAMVRLDSSLRWNDRWKGFALTLACLLPLQAHAATQVNCYRDDRPVKMLLGKEKLIVSVPRNYVAWPRDAKPEQPFVVLAAMLDGGPVCQATLNDLSRRDFQLHLSPGDVKTLEMRLANLLKQDYPIKLADNENGFIVWRGIFTTVENEKHYYYELRVPNKGAISFDGYVICTGQNITGARVNAEKCTAHEAYRGLILQYKFEAALLPELETLHKSAQQLADKVLGNPKE